MNANVTIKGLSMHITKPVEGLDRDEQVHIKLDEININLTPDSPKPQIHPDIDSVMEDILRHLPHILHRKDQDENISKHMVIGGPLPDELKKGMSIELKKFLGIE